MTVRELIDQLESFPDNLPVLVALENKDVGIDFAYLEETKTQGIDAKVVCLISKDFSEYAKSLVEKFEGYTDNYVATEADTGHSVSKEV